MKERTKLSVSNREQTKIQVSLSPPYPSPHPAHQQQMRNTAKAQRVVFCSAQEPGLTPGSSAGRLCPVGRSARDAFGCSRILRGWLVAGRGRIFAIFRLLCFAPHQPSSQRPLSPGQGLPSEWPLLSCGL